jgi:hypothetical protein
MQRDVAAVTEVEGGGDCRVRNGACLEGEGGRCCDCHQQQEGAGYERRMGKRQMTTSWILNQRRRGLRQFLSKMFQIVKAPKKKMGLYLRPIL